MALNGEKESDSSSLSSSRQVDISSADKADAMDDAMVKRSDEGVVANNRNGGEGHREVEVANMNGTSSTNGLYDVLERLAGEVVINENNFKSGSIIQENVTRRAGAAVVALACAENVAESRHDEQQLHHAKPDIRRTLAEIDDRGQDVPDIISEKAKGNQPVMVERSPTDRYVRFNELLGEGAFKRVYRAYDTAQGVEVAWNAVKVSGMSSSTRQRVVQEMRILQELDHPSIIHFYSSFLQKESESVVFITEMMASGTLKEFIQCRPVRLRIVKRWCRHILHALMYLHGHDPPIIHRDLKCDNIFINGSTGDIRIGDLGLASWQRKGAARSVLGTPEYMAPEMFEELYDEQVDIYSFGMCVLEMITKETPFMECTSTPQIYKKVISGVHPKCYHQLKNGPAKEFINECIKMRPPGECRPSADQVRGHPFLEKRDDDPEDNFICADILVPNPQTTLRRREDSLPRSEGEVIVPRPPVSRPTDSARPAASRGPNVDAFGGALHRSASRPILNSSGILPDDKYAMRAPVELTRTSEHNSLPVDLDNGSRVQEVGIGAKEKVAELEQQFPVSARRMHQSTIDCSDSVAASVNQSAVSAPLLTEGTDSGVSQSNRNSNHRHSAVAARVEVQVGGKRDVVAGKIQRLPDDETAAVACDGHGSDTSVDLKYVRASDPNRFLPVVIERCENDQCNRNGAKPYSDVELGSSDDSEISQERFDAESAPIKEEGLKAQNVVQKVSPSKHHDNASKNRLNEHQKADKPEAMPLENHPSMYSSSSIASVQSGSSAVKDPGTFHLGVWWRISATGPTANQDMNQLNICFVLKNSSTKTRQTAQFEFHLRNDSHEALASELGREVHLSRNDMDLVAKYLDDIKGQYLRFRENNSTSSSKAEFSVSADHPGASHGRVTPFHPATQPLAVASAGSRAPQSACKDETGASDLDLAEFDRMIKEENEHYHHMQLEHQKKLEEISRRREEHFLKVNTAVQPAGSQVFGTVASAVSPPGSKPFIPALDDSEDEKRRLRELAERKAREEKEILRERKEKEAEEAEKKLSLLESLSLPVESSSSKPVRRTTLNEQLQKRVLNEKLPV